MARKINAGVNVGRSDVFQVDPREVVANPEMRGRWQDSPPTPDRVQELVESFLAHGQSNPCVCRVRPSDKRLVLEQGQTRHAAALVIVENHNPDFRLKVTCVDRNEEEGFVCAIEENMIRTELSPMDYASNMRQLREQFGWDDVKIKALFRCQTAYLRQLEIILALPKKVQTLVHDGKLAVSNACLLAGRDGDAFTAALNEALSAPATPGGSINGSAVRNAVRKNGHADGKKVSRTLKDLRTKFTTYAENEESPPKVRELAELFLGYVKGEFGDRKFDARIAEICGNK